MTQTLEDLVDELGIDEMTPERFVQERARLLREFRLQFGVNAHEIDELVESGAFHTHPLVESWIDLQEMAPFLQFGERPPRRQRSGATQVEGRGSGPLHFRSSSAPSR